MVVDERKILTMDMPAALDRLAEAGRRVSGRFTL
jgi:hypothetical protein